jgi:transposase
MKKTFGQRWAAYNAAQVKEKAIFQEFLRELCARADQFGQKRGRPWVPVSDMLFCMTFKVYCGMSGRRSMTDLAMAYERGFISKVPCYNSIFKYFGMAELRPYLRQLIIQSSLPLTEVEKSFAVDSTGFSTSQSGRWLDARAGKVRSGDRRKWIKAHLMCGVLTNIVTAIEVTDANAGDAPFFPPLLNTTTENFAPREVSADKAYSSLANLKYATSKDILPFIPFRKNATPVHGTGDPLWTRLYHFYSLEKEWFERRYHQRSNIESTNAMIKTKFGEGLRSRTKDGQFNELLCKVLCHNICVTIQCSFEMDIHPTFWKNDDLKEAA